MPSRRRKRLTLETIFDSKELDEKGLRSPQWLRDNRRFSYLDDYPGTDKATVWTYDSATRERTPLFDPRGLRAEGDEDDLAVHCVVWSKDESLLLLTKEAPARFKPCGDVYVVAVADRSVRRLTRTSAAQYHPKLSPDSSLLGVVRDNDLWVVSLADGSERRLTHDGAETLYNGRCGWVYEEELGLGDAWQWSPDGSRIAFLQQDESAVPEALLSQYDQPRCDPRRTRYPKAGDPNPTVRAGVIDVADGGVRWFDLSPLGEVAEGEHYIAHQQWTPDGSAVLLQFVPRLQSRVLLLKADAASGTVSTVIDERDDAWVDHPGRLTFVEGTDQFLWPSDRDGFSHIYLYDLSGACLGLLTEGDFDVEGVCAVEPAARRFFFTAVLPSPTERSLLSASLEGGPYMVLQGTPGKHSALFAKDASRYLHYHSTLNTPPTTVLRDAYGAWIDTIVGDVCPNLTRYRVPTGNEPGGWEMVEFTSADGIRMHGRMLKPRNFDPGKSYPVLMHNYGGPGSQVVVNAWGGKGALWYHYLADLGFIVFLCDNRGTGGRGRDFTKATYLKLGQLETHDQAEGARYLASLPYVDASRIAMWGWSYGGYMAAMCILKGEDAFSAAIAVAPVTDWRLYDTIYTERYMRRPCDNEEGYREGSPVHFADKLEGRFLLLHGTMDDNVHFQNAARLASALQDAKKPFETMFYPGKHHGIEDRHYHLYSAMTDFLRRALAPSARRR